MGGGRTTIFIAANEAFPGNFVVAFPYGAVLYLLEVVKETAVMTGLDSCDGAEVSGNIGEAFLIGHFSGIGVEFNTFYLFLAGSGGQILGGGTYNAGIDIRMFNT